MHFPSRRSDKIKQQTFFFPLTLNNKALTWISEFHPKCLVTDKNEEIKMNLVCYNFLQWDYTTSKSTGVNPSHSELCFHAFSFYVLSKDRPTIFFWLSYFMKDLGQQSSSQNEIKKHKQCNVPEDAWTVCFYNGNVQPRSRENMALEFWLSDTV